MVKLPLDSSNKATFAQLVEAGRIAPVVDIEMDEIYSGKDCEEVTAQFLDEGLFEFIVGGKRKSICKP